MSIKLNKYQLEAIEKLRNGSVLCGGVGSGKSRTALGYYLFKVCEGDIRINDYEQLPWDQKDTHKKYVEMKKPRDLYIITTAKKRDSLEWNKECASFVFGEDRESSHSNIQVTIDSWNNIKKYNNVYGCFFIFDEQRVVGTGAWVKTFLNITRKNKWILLSATPGDQWKDYIPLFVANGFFKNKTEFNRNHCVFSRFSKYPKIERYIGTKILERYRDQILVCLKDDRNTVRHFEYVEMDYDKDLYRLIFRDRWDPYDNCPIEETGKLLYLIRKSVNSDPTRMQKLLEIYEKRGRVIVFYNYNYELEKIRDTLSDEGIMFSEWNGQKHEEVPVGRKWIYLVQYSAGCEGWNCVSTNTMVFYSQNYSYRIMEQACGRIDRMNTLYNDLYYYVFRSRSSIDMAIYSALKRKKNFNERSFVK